MQKVSNLLQEQVSWRLAIIVSFLFFVKAIIFAFWITPFGDIPDEPDHFAYVRYIALENNIPLLGEAKTITFDKFENIKEANSLNPIVQHPPLYHIVSALLFKMVSVITEEDRVLLRVPRVISALSGAIVLFFLFKILNALAVAPIVSISAVVSVASIPMFTNLSSGVSSEMLLVLLVALGIYYWLKYILTRDVRDIYILAFVFSLAVVTKITALAVMLPVLMITFFELDMPIANRLKHILTVSVVGMFLPMLWFLRNIYYFDNAFISRNHFDKWKSLLLDAPLTDSFYYYISSYPVLDSFFVNFFGLFGYVGTKRAQSIEFAGAVTHQVAGMPLYIFSVIIFFLVAIMLYIYFRKILNVKNEVPSLKGMSFIDFIVSSKFIASNRNIFFQILSVLVVVTVLVTFVAVYTYPGFWGEVRHFAFSVVSGLFVASLAVVFLPMATVDRVVSYLLLIIGVFFIALVWKVYGGYLKTGHMVAVHGRYMFVLIPMYVVVMSLLVSEVRYKAFVFIVPLLMIYAELSTFIGQVIPFYKGG